MLDREGLEVRELDEPALFGAFDERTSAVALEQFVKLNAVGWHTFLDMVDAAARGASVEPREAYMKRNADRYGVELPKRPA